MDNQHRQITGYRELDAREIELMNHAKKTAEVTGDFVDGLAKFESIDKRWLAIAKTDLQKGYMALVRAIAKPETF